MGAPSSAVPSTRNVLPADNVPMPIAATLAGVNSLSCVRCIVPATKLIEAVVSNVMSDATSAPPIMFTVPVFQTLSVLATETSAPVPTLSVPAPPAAIVEPPT